ncbi:MULTISPECIES: type II toxin-antitoxin system prevent-host-death family antitoxin [unclassified Frankia]|uniref:type II toxin-antitoxin system Phd/YefM family antitoxin n=1 Tax=unclassified Frankia TaxID=2632575 RepID=UPI002AD26EB8|nr:MULTISPECIES: type II toxin-antitoxin system prevent-host-death family antitoxin [unclassified Frankia]
MTEVAVRDLRNHGGEILDRVMGGESLTVTRDGRAVAELRPLPRRPLPASLLLERWRRMPAVDPVRLRADIDSVLDPAL